MTKDLLDFPKIKSSSIASNAVSAANLPTIPHSVLGGDTNFIQTTVKRLCPVKRFDYKYLGDGADQIIP